MVWDLVVFGFWWFMRFVLIAWLLLWVSCEVC